MFQKEIAVSDGGDGFDGCIEVVQRTRGYRRWPDEAKARIVAESFQPGVRVVDIARRHGLVGRTSAVGLAAASPPGEVGSAGGYHG
ncbi:transposase, partial [Loktanella fryxellensis]|uniref:transposase n=1 Tax=Loktanella fryxellensis TaxID=245187 RepID=UPI001FE1DDB2